MGDALLRLWDRYPNYQRRTSPSSGGMKSLLKYSQQAKQAAPQPLRPQECGSPGGGRLGKVLTKEAGGARKDRDRVGPDGDGPEVKAFASGSPAGSPTSDSPCTVSSGSQESYNNPDLDPSSSSHSHLHGHQESAAAQGYPSRGFNFQTPAGSSATAATPLMSSHGVYAPSLQVAPGFNPMYHVGPMGPAVLPSQSSLSPRPGMSPVMILQRGAGGSPGQVHPHPGFIGQGYGGQAPGAYQGQGAQGQK